MSTVDTTDLMKRSVNVLDYGARMDGSWDVPAYNAARAATGYNGVVEVPPGQFWADVQADPMGEYGDTLISGGHLYHKTSSGWYRVQMDSF